MKEEKAGVVIPFWGGMVFPFEKLGQNFKVFFELTGAFAFFSAIFSMFVGRGFACGLGFESKMFFCTGNALSLMINVMMLLFLTALFIRRWWYLSFEKQSFSGVVRTKIGIKDFKILGFLICFLCLWAIIAVGVYALYIRKATPNLNFELAWFIFVSLFIVAAFFVLINAVLFVRFLEGKNWLLLNKTAFPMFDNVYKLIAWFLFYLLIFAYLFQLVGRVFFVCKSFFPVWMCSFIGDFSLYFVFYLMIICFVSLLKYQEMHIFADEER